jgi:hypothetical protein
MSVASAWALSTHGVRVTLTEEPVHTDQFAEGDALNPLVWSVTNQTTGAALTVVAATMSDADVVDLVTLEPLGDDLEMHAVSATGLLALSGDLTVPPTSASFLGVVQTVDPVDAQRVDFRDRDLSNPPFQISRGLGYAGTLVIGDDGDFETDAGKPLIKKLVLRRMNTIRGSFGHLRNYGVATLEKEPLGSGGDLVRYLRDVESQAKQEPDVQDARARGSIDRNGVLIIQLAITASGGATINMRMGQRSGQLVET